MTELRQRIEAIRSRRYLDGAKGEPCKFRFAGICNHSPETVVACHVRNEAFGMGRKADDFSVIDGCSNCHTFYDLHSHEMDRALLLEYVLRGLQETMRARIDRGLLVLSQDVAKPFADRPVTPRKPAEQRAKIASRSEIQSRGFRPSEPQHRATSPVQRKADRSD